MAMSDASRIIINPIATPLYICWQHHSFIIDWFWDPIIADKTMFFDELSTMYFTSGQSLDTWYFNLEIVKIKFPKNAPNEQQVVRVLRWFLDRKVATYHRGYWLWDHYRSETKQS